MIKPGWGFSFDYEPGQYIGIGLLVDGRWRWRSYSLTSSPADLWVSPQHPHGDDHREGDARRLPVHAPGRRRPARHNRATGRAAGQFRAARPGAAGRPVPHGGLRDHAGDVDAAHAGPARSDHRRHPPAFGAHGRRRDVRGGTRAAGRRACWLPAAAARDAQPGTAGPVPARRRGAGLAAATDLGLRPRGHARRRGAGLVGGRHQDPTAPRAVRGIEGGPGRDRRHGHVRQERKVRRSRRRDLADGCRGAVGRTDAVRLPDGHLPVVRGNPDCGHVRDLRTGMEHEPGTRVQTCVSAASGDCTLDV